MNGKEDAYCSSLGKLKVKNVNLLKNLLGLIQSLSPALSQTAQSVPLITDALGTSIHTHAVVVFQSTATDLV